MLANLRLKEMCVAPWQYSVFSWKRILVCFSIQWKICGEKKVLFLKNLLIEYIIKHYFFPSTPSEFQNDWLLSFPTWSFSLKYLAFDGGREKTFPIKFIDLFDLKSYPNSDFLIFFFGQWRHSACGNSAWGIKYGEFLYCL